MRGIVKPCRHRLGPELHARWLGHLCGLCLSLRDTAGQPARVLTGYDVLLVSILTEAQTGRLATTHAGACALRGFRTAEVVDSSTSAMQAGTAVALLAGGAGLADKVEDGDVAVWLRPVVARSARRAAKAGTVAAQACGLDGTEVSSAPDRAREIEARPDAGLDELLAPAGRAVAAMFAHTAAVAGLPGNAAPLRQAGDAFGRLVHLVDAGHDRASDRRHGHFNPLEATGTSDVRAGELARRLHADLLVSLEEMDLVDRALAEALLGPTVGAAIDATWTVARPPRVRSRAGVAVGVAAAMVAQAAMWGGGRRGGRRRNNPYGNGPYGNQPYGNNPYGNGPYGGGPYGRGGRRGYGRRGGPGGMSCCELLACDCCANCVCDECCGGDVCCCAA